MPKQNISLWWEKEKLAGYVAKRVLIGPDGVFLLAPFASFVIYFCSKQFEAERLEDQFGNAPLTQTYLINGEKEPLQAVEDSPWTRALLHIPGGVVRKNPPEIIPLLYSVMAFETTDAAPIRENSNSDQVPLVQDSNCWVRIVNGSYKGKTNPTLRSMPVVVLDVVLAQGGVFDWSLPHDYQAFAYVISGLVDFGKNEQIAACRTDSLIRIDGRKLYVSSQCAGGRFLLIAARVAQPKHENKNYKKIDLKPLKLL